MVDNVLRRKNAAKAAAAPMMRSFFIREPVDCDASCVPNRRCAATPKRIASEIFIFVFKREATLAFFQELNSWPFAQLRFTAGVGVTGLSGIFLTACAMFNASTRYKILSTWKRNVRWVIPSLSAAPFHVSPLEIKLTVSIWRTVSRNFRTHVLASRVSSGCLIGRFRTLDFSSPVRRCL